MFATPDTGQLRLAGVRGLRCAPLPGPSPTMMPMAPAKFLKADHRNKGHCASSSLYGGGQGERNAARGRDKTDVLGVANILPSPVEETTSNAIDFSELKPSLAETPFATR